MHYRRTREDNIKLSHDCCELTFEGAGYCGPERDVSPVTRASAPTSRQVKGLL